MTRVLPAVMGRAIPVVLGVILPAAGCAQLAGIDDTNSRGRGGNSLSVTRMSIGNTIVESPQDLTGLSATYLVPNAEQAEGFDRVLAADVGQGKWSADLQAPAAVQFTLPDVPKPIPRSFAFPNRELSILYAVLEHPNRTPAPDNAMLTVSAKLEAATTAADAFRVLTVGAWTQHLLTGAEVPAVGATQVGFTYAFANSQSLSGRPQLDQLTVDDAFFLLRYSGNTLTGVAEAAAFNQTGNDVVNATMATVMQSETLDVKIDPARLNQRYAAVRPAVTGLAMSWAMFAAPAYRIASDSGPVLGSGAIAATDVGVSAKYGNPFAGRGWNSMLRFLTVQTRSYTPAGTTTPVTLEAGLRQFLEPPAPGTELTLPAGLPQTISMNGTPLTTDGQTVAPPAKFVEITFITDIPTATLYSLQLFELVPNAANTALDRVFVFSAASSEAKFQLPPELFQPGHRYTLRAFSTQGGYPAIASGDFLIRELPLSFGYLDSAVFTVMP